MGIEIDFFPVGDKDRSGDAILFRYGNLHGPRNEQTIVLIDGGFKETGDRIINFLPRYYDTNYIDLVISSHSDNDHINGLLIVLDNVQVNELWMHLPWNHTEDINKMFKDNRVTDNSVREKLQKSLQSAKDLEQIAYRKNIPITEPFLGKNYDDKLFVLGPSEQYCESLLPEFRGTPIPKFKTLTEELFEGAREAIKKIAESWNFETLDNSGETSAENNTSTVLLLNNENKYYLFTADAGQPALEEVISVLDAINLEYNKISFIQVPHHGSQRNVNPFILDKLLGSIKKEDKKLRTAFASVSKYGAPKHPSKKVTNAFRRRGTHVYSTEGYGIVHQINAPERPNYSSFDPIIFFKEVEE